MRILLNFNSENEVEFNGNIRENFISFIKKTFQESNSLIYQFLFGNKKVKPYVFSPHLGMKFEVLDKVNKKIKVGKKISLIFSTGDFELISYFWNGLLSLKENKKDYITINKEKFVLKNILLLPNRNIKSKEIIFKTVGISILTDSEKSANDFSSWYITPREDNIERFNEVLNKRTEEKLKYLKGINKKISLEFQFVNENSIIETVIPHYNGYVKGFRGKFILRGDVEILQFIYDYGFGVRTGQGFGLLDIVDSV